jgi:outer membrane biosynthesis protein TonB
MNTLHRKLKLPLCLLACAVATPLMAQSMTVPPARLSSYWILLNQNVSVDVPNTGRNLDKPGCVAVSYTIGSDGVTRDIKVRKVVPESDLGSAAVSAVTDFKYGPSLTNRAGQPVATYYVVPFNSPDDPAAQAKLMAPCQLPGYDNS